MIFSLVLDMNDSRVHPAPDSENEHRFIRYAIARFGAFSNIAWDLGDDLDQYRDDRWAHATGTLIKMWDPYRHLATSHPVGKDAPGSYFRLVRLHLISGVVESTARLHAGTAKAAGKPRPDHPADE